MPVGSVLMRETLSYSYSASSIFKTDISLSKRGGTHEKEADEQSSPHYLFICSALEDETDVAQVLFLSADI